MADQNKIFEMLVRLTAATEKNAEATERAAQAQEQAALALAGIAQRLDGLTGTVDVDGLDADALAEAAGGAVDAAEDAPAGEAASDLDEFVRAFGGRAKP